MYARYLIDFDLETIHALTYKVIMWGVNGRKGY